MTTRSLRAACAAASLAFACLSAVQAQQSNVPPGTPARGAQAPAAAATKVNTRNFAPGFERRTTGSKLVIVPPDVELFSQSVGGVLEPKADWTDAANRHFRTALMARKEVLADNAIELDEKELDALAQLNALHGAVAEAVFVHHMMNMPALPTKEGKLDWSLGDAVQPLRERTGADYALFFWIRDSYATAERKAAMVAMAILFGAVVPGGQQIGYASLVDLRDGRIVWFNNLARLSGDLRDAKAAVETVEVLMQSFPAAR
jgi:hypothetical protein